MKDKLKRAFNIVAIADIHFGKKNDKKLYDDLKKYFISNITDLINDYNHIDMIVICGDLFDRIIKLSEPASGMIMEFIETLCKLSEDNNFWLRIVKGTSGHDYNQLDNLHHLEVKYPMFSIIHRLCREEVSKNGYEYRILYLPEEYPEDYNKYYESYLTSIDHEVEPYDFIFGHGMIDFVAFTGNEEIKRKIKRNEAVHSVELLDKMSNYFCIFGHIHDFKNYKDKDKIMYTGSFERFSFTDQEDKGYLFCRLDPETEETEVFFIENENASIYNILDLSDYEFKSTEEKLKFINEQKEECDYLKVIIPKNEDNKEILKGVLSNDIKIESHNEIPEDVVDERFLFLIKRELPLDKSIKKYIELTTGKKYSVEDINKFINKVEKV